MWVWASLEERFKDVPIYTYLISPRRDLLPTFILSINSSESGFHYKMQIGHDLLNF